MKHVGIRNADFVSDKFNPVSAKEIYWNLEAPQLTELSLNADESQLTNQGAVVVTTGKHTGRSPSDKFIVMDDETKDAIWWDNSASMTRYCFDLLLADFMAHCEDKTLYAQDLYGGADPQYRLNTRVFCEYAWHSQFIRHLMIRPPTDALATFEPELTIIDLPSFKADPEKYGCRTETVIACDLTRKIILIGGTEYAGEMKKSVFSFLNYTLPGHGIMPMHCSANTGKDEDNTAIFFGLSGTGKTTLSADPNRILIGDDEHGWGENGIFNMEGGCYAKTIKLSPESEPEIFAATQREGTILENVILNNNNQPDFDNVSLTENTRCAYPLEAIPNASLDGRASHPRTIIMLTADAFGILPPIAKLTPEQAMYHFLSGYTAKVAGTERGITEPAATFSACFGAPFMPRHPSVYGDLLRKLIQQYGTSCWLVNTGWTGGPYAIGSRMPIKVTRTLLSQALSGELDHVPMRKDPLFSFMVPESCDGVDAGILDPRSTWNDPDAYDAQAEKLSQMFIDNFSRFSDCVDQIILDAAPTLRAA